MGACIARSSAQKLSSYALSCRDGVHAESPRPRGAWGMAPRRNHEMRAENFSFFVARNHRARPLASSGGTSHGVVAGGSVGDFRTRLAEVDSRERARTHGGSRRVFVVPRRRDAEEAPYPVSSLVPHERRDPPRAGSPRRVGGDPGRPRRVSRDGRPAPSERTRTTPTSSPSSPTCPTASGGTPPSAPTRTRPGERR